MCNVSQKYSWGAKRDAGLEACGLVSSLALACAQYVPVVPLNGAFQLYACWRVLARYFGYLACVL